MCNATICIDDQTGKPAVIPEKKRYEAKIDCVAALMDAYVAYKANKEAFD